MYSVDEVWTRLRGLATGYSGRLCDSHDTEAREQASWTVRRRVQCALGSMSCSAVDEEHEDAKLVGINHARVA